MTRGSDQRIELELAVFSLTQPMATATMQAPAASQPVAAAAPQPFTSAPVSAPAPAVAPPAQQPAAVPAVPPIQTDDPPLPPDPEFLQPELPPIPQPTPAPAAPAATQPAARKREPPKEAGSLEPFIYWPNVLADLEETDAMLISFLRNTRAYYDGRRVLFECSDAFRDYIRSNREVSKKLKESPAVSIDQTLKNMQALGVDIKIEDK